MSVHPVGAPERDEPSEQPLHRWRFGSAEFDEARSELRVGGLLVDVQPKPLQLLARLLAAPGEVVPKDQLLKFQQMPIEPSMFREPIANHQS